ncbi:NAD(P)/FAD-dependent oxidoreductase [Cellulomonas pakistanensis]|uniref:N-acylamino acid racemase n=1 Tax=Cellulomonas pakistanensis TaxID=992287 RepID=A0A919U707_9CELL|nr:FAD-dependent oxidoreductase [Cellulomonas pakistanensis]GIG36805.1 N-acylamino acid racemase [Cellulomonas pakistanensis]
MLDSYDYVVVGAGMAGDAAARGIREVDPDGTLLVIGREPTAPVTRPALTKKLWTDPDFTFDQVWLATAEDARAELLLGESVIAVDTGARTVTTDADVTVGYGRLLLATSGHPRRLPGVEESGRIIYFRTVRDYERLRDLAGGGRHVVVVGGGYIGTELAAALVQNDTRVTLVHRQDVLTGATFPDGLARHVERRYADAGVTLLRGSTVASAESGADGVTVRLADGAVVEADAVVVGAGIEVETDLARAAGLEVGDGIAVDDRLRTSDPHVWAAGDVALYPDRILGRRRVEHVDNATSMGRQAGRNLAGADEPYDHTPFFYSDLFEYGYEAVGRLDASLETVEDWHEDGFGAGVVYYLDGGRVAGVLLWNVWDATDRAREVLAGQTDVRTEALRGLIR